MSKQSGIVAVFDRHSDAEAAIKKLADANFDITKLSIVGKGYHSDERVVGFYNAGDRIKFWGKYGAFWGALWGLLVSGVFMTVPLVGPVMVLGHLAAMVVTALEGAIVVGGFSALGAALFSIGIPKNSILQYEDALRADGFLVTAVGTPEEIARAKTIIEAQKPSRLDVHEGIHPEGGHIYSTGHTAWGQ